MPDPLIGRQLGKYQIQQEIGRGGMARVYRAVDTVLQRPVALKVLAPSLSADPEFARRFEREAITAANMRHPAIVTIFDVGEADGLRYIAMEYIAGRTLNDVLEEHGKLGLPLTIAILGPVADALDFAHGHAMVHRDIKPHNIMLDTDGRVLLTDFGIAIDPAESTERLTRTGMFMGTPEYISPEQAQAQPLTGRSDQYALGIVAYEMLAGRVPFDGGTPQQIMAHVYQAPPRVASFDPQAPPEIDQIFARVLAKDPGQRFERSGQLVEALRYVARRYGMNTAGRNDVAALAIPLGSSAGQATVAMRTPTGSPAARNPQAGQPTQGTPPVGASVPPAAPFPIADVFGDPRSGARPRPATNQQPPVPIQTGGYGSAGSTPPTGNRAAPPPSRHTTGRNYSYGGNRADDQFAPPPRVPRRRTYDEDGGSNVPWTLLAFGAIALVTIVLIFALTRNGSLFTGAPRPNPFAATETPPPTATAEATVLPSATVPAPTPVPIIPDPSVLGQSPPPEFTPVPTAEPPIAPTEAPTVEPTVAPTEAPTAEPTLSPTEAPTLTATPFITETPVPTDIPVASASTTAIAPTSTAISVPTATPLPPGVPTPVGGGGRLVYFTNTGLVVRDVATGTSESIITLTDLEPMGPPAVSPDGTMFLLDVRDPRTNTRQILAVDRKGQLQALTNAPGESFNPSWRPDGKAIVFASTRNGSADLFVMDPDGTNQQQITNELADEQYPSFSPDGTRLIFESNRENGTWGLFTIDPQGGMITPVPRTTPPGQTANDRQPRWSPDGNSITFVSDRDRPDGSFEVYTQQLDKINVQRITTFANGSANSPSYSPDGTLIAFYSNSNDSNDLYIVDLAQDEFIQSPGNDPAVEERFPSWGK